jgi:primosomal protein N'
MASRAQQRQRAVAAVVAVLAVLREHQYRRSCSQKCFGCKRAAVASVAQRQRIRLFLSRRLTRRLQHFFSGQTPAAQAATGQVQRLGRRGQQVRLRH